MNSIGWEQGMYRGLERIGLRKCDENIGQTYRARVFQSPFRVQDQKYFPFLCKMWKNICLMPY
jgi:hypothetical protein